MSDEDANSGRVAIGISFGNAYSSIAFTTPVRTTAAVSLSVH